MKVIDIKEVEPLNFRPHVTINQHSYYMEPRYTKTSSGGGMSDEDYEKILKQINAVKNEVRTNTAKLSTIEESVTNLSEEVTTKTEEIDILTERVGNVESSTTSMSTLVQAATNNATQALNEVRDLRPATAGEVNAVCN